MLPMYDINYNFFKLLFIQVFIVQYNYSVSGIVAFLAYGYASVLSSS